MSPELGPIARRLKQLAERGQEIARDERRQTMRPGPGVPGATRPRPAEGRGR